jgi:hypothetical protein
MIRKDVCIEDAQDAEIEAGLEAFDNSRVLGKRVQARKLGEPSVVQVWGRRPKLSLLEDVSGPHAQLFRSWRNCDGQRGAWTDSPWVAASRNRGVIHPC